MILALRITHILFPFFVGMIIGGLIVHSPAFWITGIALVVLDFIIGSILQYLVEQKFR